MKVIFHNESSFDFWTKTQLSIRKVCCIYIPQTSSNEHDRVSSTSKILQKFLEAEQTVYNLTHTLVVSSSVPNSNRILKIEHQLVK